MSDHIPLMAKLKIQLRLPRKSKVQPKYDLDLLKQDEYKEKFSVKVKNRFSALINEFPVPVENNEKK